MRVVVLAAIAVATWGCATLGADPVWTPDDEAPLVAERPAGCHIDVFEDGQAVPRRHAVLGRLVLEMSEGALRERGPAGALAALKEAACARGAFIIKDLRALTTGTRQGLRYEATIATLLGDDGKPLNELPDPAPGM